MNNREKNEITKIAKEFLAGMTGTTFNSINETGWLLVDPLSSYFHSIGIDHTIVEIPAKNDRPTVLILVFMNGDYFIPTGGDLVSILPDAKNFMWLDPTKLIL